MLTQPGRAADVRTSISDPLRIDSVMIPAIRATPSFTLGITLSPGLKSRGAHGKDWGRDMGLDLDAIETWRPTVIAHISNLYSEAFNLMRSRFTSERVHLVKTSSWPVPEVASEIRSRDRTCRRIINLMRSLSLEDPSSSLRLLINGNHGGQECATLAAQVVMRAGHTRERSVELIEKIRPGLFNTVAQTRFLQACPVGNAEGVFDAS